MELNEIVLNGNNQAWVRWKGNVEVLMQYVSPETDREIRGRANKPRWQGHQRMESEVDEVAVRDYYCTHIIKAMRGLTENGQPLEPKIPDFKMYWDGNHEFGLFVVHASRDLQNFVAEKND